MRFRGFLNSDTPKLARVWAEQPVSRCVARCVRPQMLEDHVFARPYFDPAGLLIAEQGDEVLGFLHCGFGPNEDESDIDPSIGVICLALFSAQADVEEVGPQLIAAGERYLQDRGAKVIYAGSVKPLNPFYLGFYGGSELPGLLPSQAPLVRMLCERGYTEADRSVTLECDLARTRPPVDRRVLQNKRRYRVELETTVPARSWWDACTSPPTEVQRFVLYPATGDDAVGRVCFWLVEPLSTSRGVSVAGLTELTIDESLRGQGLAMYLNAEAMKQLKLQRFDVVEAQTMVRNVAAVKLYEKLGFLPVEEGVILRKA